MKKMPLGLQRRQSQTFLRGAQQHDEHQRLQVEAREILIACKRKKITTKKVIKQEQVVQRGTGVSVLDSFQDLTAEGPEQPHLTHLEVFQQAIIVPYSSLAYYLGNSHVTSYCVRIRFTRRWQNVQTEQERQGLSKAECAHQPAFRCCVHCLEVVEWQHWYQTS